MIAVTFCTQFRLHSKEITELKIAYAKNETHIAFDEDSTKDALALLNGEILISTNVRTKGGFFTAFYDIPKRQIGGKYGNLGSV